MKKIKLGDACEILNGFAFKSENYVGSGIRVIRISNVQKGYIEDNGVNLRSWLFFIAIFPIISVYLWCCS